MAVGVQPRVPAAILQEKKRRELCIGVWVGPRADLNV